MVRETMGINISLNPHQLISAAQKKDRVLRFKYCPHCRRYGWVERVGDRYQCLQCGRPIEEKKDARGSNDNNK